MQEEEEGKMKIGQRGPCDYIMYKRKKRPLGLESVVGVLVQPLDALPQLPDSSGGIVEQALQEQHYFFHRIDHATCEQLDSL